MKLHRDIGVSQPTAWFMLHRIREAWTERGGQFSGSVEVDETYMGGKESNKHADKKLNAGRGMVGKSAVVGAKDRESNRVSARTVESANKATLHGFIAESANPSAVIYTDDHPSMADRPSNTKPSSIRSASTSTAWPTRTA